MSKIYGYGCDCKEFTLKSQKIGYAAWCRLQMQYDGFKGGDVVDFVCDTYLCLHEPFLHRPEAKLLLIKMQKGDTLYLSRPWLIATNRDETIAALDTLKRKGIMVIFPSAHRKPDTEQGINDWIHDACMSHNALSALKSGQPGLTKRPIGWERKGGTGTWQPFPEERAVAKCLAQLYHEFGMSHDQIMIAFKSVADSERIRQTIWAAVAEFPITNPGDLKYEGSHRKVPHLSGTVDYGQRRDAYDRIRGACQDWKRQRNIFEEISMVGSSCRFRLEELMAIGAVERKKDDKGVYLYHAIDGWEDKGTRLSLKELCRFIFATGPTVPEMAFAFRRPMSEFTYILGRLMMLHVLEKKPDREGRNHYSLQPSFDIRKCDWDGLLNKIKGIKDAVS